MTTLARTGPAMRRLFAGLDYSPQPHEEALKAVLEAWRSLKEGRLHPPIGDLGGVAGRVGAFLFETTEGARDFVVRTAGPGLDHLLGHLDGGDRLSDSARPRGAARLRRLFAAVAAAGEPVLAEFAARDSGEYFRIVAAPATADGRTVGGIFGAVAWRPMAVRPAGRAAAFDHAPVVFGLAASNEFAARVCRALALPLNRPEERTFEDGEFKIRPLANVRNREVYVVGSLNGDAGGSANDKLCRLLFLIGALKDAAAAHVTAVVPYLCYQRKDRQTKPRDPVTSRYVAQLLEAVGTDRVIALEVHNLAAYQNAFRCDSEHLDADALFARRFRELLGTRPVTVLSPDAGGTKRAERFRQRLERELGRAVAGGMMEKFRSAGVVGGETLLGDVAGRAVVIFDDLISSGGTMRRAAAACRERGAAAVHAAAVHGLLSTGAGETLRAAGFDHVVLTDSVALPEAETAAIADRLSIVGVAELFAEAIRRCHAGGSIVGLLREGAGG
jgi:ribose-phosphate pyrophosphokinase